MFQRGYAVLIGVGGNLPVTVKDATDLRDVLVDPARAGYPKDQVRLLAEGAATRSDVLEALDELAAQIKQITGATVMIYFSGHGGRPTDTVDATYYLVPYGYDPADPAKTGVSGAEFTQKVAALNASRLLVILDCCHAGGMAKSQDGGQAVAFKSAAAPQELLAELGTGDGRVVIASSRDDELSWADAGNSVFTACLLDALSGKGSKGADGYARILDVLSYLFEETPKRAPEPQHPFVNKIENLSDNFALCYYAGGSKSIPGLAPKPVPALDSLRQLEIQGLIEAAELLTKKINYLRKVAASQAPSAYRFQTDQELLDAEAERAAHKARIEALSEGQS